MHARLGDEGQFVVAVRRSGERFARTVVNMRLLREGAPGSDDDLESAVRRPVGLRERCVLAERQRGEQRRVGSSFATSWKYRTLSAPAADSSHLGRIVVTAD
jgi:hypothetical protein